MIPVRLPWLVIYWVDEEDHVHAECLGCGWCASLLDRRSATDLDPLFDQLGDAHQGCNPDNRPLRLLRQAGAVGYNDPGE